uniref:Putative alpha-L-fucosidase n=1 Tax=Timema genevievae TaxID=629358 RepID=A0A7R9PIP4_TIMGE|nr:unnamed protein product [Timema genevievae]
MVSARWMLNSLVLIVITSHLVECENTTPASQIDVQYNATWESLDSRPLPPWYDEAKIGIFLHWGVFSVPGFGSEWFWQRWRGNYSEYVEFMDKNYPPGYTYQDFARDFTAEFYNPDDWAELFQSSGAKYVVLTSKHHEGYTLWPSSVSFSWNSVDVGPHRDLLGDLANSIRSKTDLKFGVYHSMFEWFNPLYMRDKSTNFSKQTFVGHKTIPELYELVNTYKPDVIWSDGDAEAPDSYWMSTDFLAWLYNESPVKSTVVVNDRWGKGVACHHGGYYTCNDRYNPGVLLKHKWENCMTLDKRSWGFRRNAKLSDYLTTAELIQELAETISCGGNILINVGPTKDGIIAPIFEERLRDLGSWLKVNGKAIYSTKSWVFQNDTVTSGSGLRNVNYFWALRSSLRILNCPYLVEQDNSRLGLLVCTTILVHLVESESTTPASQTNVQYNATWESLDSRPLPQWYDEAKIGIFLHWGVFSVPSFGSEWFWINWKENMSKYVEFMDNNYPPGYTYQDFARDFTAEFYNPDDWAELFQSSGAKYVVLTSKHHEGYTLWPSAVSFSWNSVDVGPHRDLLGELANSIRSKTDLKFGVYHSLMDWFHPLYLRDKFTLFTEQMFVKQKSIPELHELVNAYNPEVIWSDGDWEAPDSYWTAKEFLAWLYNDSPVKDTVVVNDRWGSGIPCKHGGYYTCTDRYNPGVLIEHKWENCMTLDKASWGYRRNAKLSDYLTTAELVQEVVETVSCGGNILINVGPTKDGIIAPIFEERLRDLGSWLKVNGEAIYSSKPWTFQNDTITSGVYTKGNENDVDQTVYAIVLEWPKERQLLLGSPKLTQDSKLSILGGTGQLKWSQTSMGVTVQFPERDSLSTDWAWVVRIEGIMKCESHIVAIKMLSAISIVFVSTLLVVCSTQDIVRYNATWESLDTRPLPQWYDDAKFGIFIHWGLYSVPGFGSEWFWNRWATNYSEYVEFMKKNYPPGFTYQDFAPEFKAEFFDPDEWTELFQAAGAKYVVLTTKHHEGYTLWPSKYSFSWNAKDVGPNRDLVGDFSDAIRKTDIKLGLYHSLFEFYNPLYLMDKANNYSTRLFADLKTIPEMYELVEEYKPDVFWSDGGEGSSVEYWQSREFISWLYNDSPVKDTIVVNDRWGDETMCEHGDFFSCSDRYNPGTLQAHKWENCMTIDQVAWGYRRNAKLSDYLSIEELIYSLVSTVSTGGNLLLNIAPNKDGVITPIFEERLRDIGSWLTVNGEAIYSTVAWSSQLDNANSNWRASDKETLVIFPDKVTVSTDWAWVIKITNVLN